jgi:hypothetical protein
MVLAALLLSLSLSQSPYNRICILHIRFGQVPAAARCEQGKEGKAHRRGMVGWRGWRAGCGNTSRQGARKSLGCGILIVCSSTSGLSIKGL